MGEGEEVQEVEEAGAGGGVEEGVGEVQEAGDLKGVGEERAVVAWL